MGILDVRMPLVQLFSEKLVNDLCGALVQVDASYDAPLNVGLA